MIATSQLTLAGTLDHPDKSTQIPRGDKRHPISAWDLIAFGRSPRRWVLTPPDPEPRKLRARELVQALWLAPAWAQGHLVRRPATYTHTSSQCPKCKSSGTGRVCRNCGLARVQVGEERPWTGSATFCKAWIADMTGRELEVVPAQDWDAAEQMVQRLIEDTATGTMGATARTLQHFSGTWTDTATGLDIPVYGTAELVPSEGNTMDMALGSVHVTSDSGPFAWASYAYQKGLHVAAALAHELHAEASGDRRAHHIWALVEGKEPWLVGRRRCTPELLARGLESLNQLLAAYARCLDSGQWPAFDPEAANSLTDWSPVYLEPWMTQGDGTNGNYFAVVGAPREVLQP